MPTSNLLDQLETLTRTVTASAVRAIPSLKENAAADAMLAAADETTAALLRERLPGVAPVDEVLAPGGDQRLHVTFTDDAIANVGETLEAGDAPCLRTDDLAAGRDVIVDFCDPNATKALHVGHLRNIAIGQAIAGALRAAGATVARQTHIGDAGRSMGEAMAGYRLYAEPHTPQHTGEKPDHFVGRMYARYVREHEPVNRVQAGDEPVARDLDGRQDLAQKLLDGVQRNDPDAVALWKQVRGWAVSGQNETLARLGVSFERVIYDSDRSRLTANVVELGIRQGLFVREPEGTVVYPTGDDSYPYLPLTRADGFPTHHMRTIAMWRDLMHADRGKELIHPSGEEWRAHSVHVEEALKQMEPGVPILPTQHVLHGMVSADDGELSSSKGSAQLIDTLLDQLASSPAITEIACDSNPNLTADTLTTITLFGYMLDRPVTKEMTLPDTHAILDGEQNPGWKIAVAWAAVNRPSVDGTPQPQPDDPAYRHAVLQAQTHRRNLAVALANGNDLLKYVRYLGHLSDWYLSAERPANISRVIRAALTHGLDALGLLRDRTQRT